MEKRTDKHKKKTQGGFYSEFARLDPKGKSGKVKDEMVADLKNCVTHQLTRIKKLKYVLEIYKAKDTTQKLIKQKRKSAVLLDTKNKLSQKLNRRDNNIEDLDLEVKDLEATVRAKEREIKRLENSLDKQEDLLTVVKSSKKQTKYIEKPLTLLAKKLERIAEKGVDEKFINNLEYLNKTNTFLKSNLLTLEQLSIVTLAELLGNVKSFQMGVNYRVLNRLVELGYLSCSSGLIKASKYWFVSLKGKQIIKDYKNYLSFGKSVITK